MTDVATAPETAQRTVGDWLAAFNAALEAKDAAAAARCSRPTSFWRDLVALTWNIKTVEGRDEIGTCSSRRSARRAARLRHHRARDRGRRRDRGLARVRDGGRGAARPICGWSTGKAWTLLTTLEELKGYEEPRGTAAPEGRRARGQRRPRVVARAPPARGRRTGLRDAARGADRRRRPGRDRAGARACASSMCRRSWSTGMPARVTSGVTLQVAVPARPGLVRPSALHQVPGQLAGVLAQGQDRRLAGDVHAGDGAQLLDSSTDATSGQL